VNQQKRTRAQLTDVLEGVQIRTDRGLTLVARLQLEESELLAISMAVDAEAQALAVSYGARVLLDKMKLYQELVPAIMKFVKPTSSWSDSQFAPPNFFDCDTA